MNITTQSEELQILLVDLRELTETNCHGEALERVARFFKYQQLVKAFESVNTLHSIVGYLDSPIAELRTNFYNMLFAKIKNDHGEEVRKAVYDCL